MTNKLKHRLWLAFAKLLDYFSVSLPFFICWFYYYSNVIINPFYRMGNFIIAILYVFVFGYLCRVYDADEISLHRISEVFYSQILSFLVADGFIYLLICVLSRRLVNLIPGLMCIAAQFVIALAWSYFVHLWYFKSFPAKKTIIVYDNQQDMENLINEYGLDKKFDVHKICQID